MGGPTLQVYPQPDISTRTIWLFMVATNSCNVLLVLMVMVSRMWLLMVANYGFDC